MCRKTAAFLTYLNISTTCKTLSLVGKQNIVYLGLLLKCSISVCAFLPSFFRVQRYSPERLAWHVMTHAFLLLKENKHLQDNKASHYQKRIQYKQNKMQHMILGTIQTLDHSTLAGFSLVPCRDICGRAHWPCFIRSPSTGWAQTKHSRPLVGACMLFLVEEICRHCLHRRVYKGWESLRTGIQRKKNDGLSCENKRDPQQKMLTNRLFKKNCPSLVFQLDTDDPIVQGEKKTQLVSLLAVRQAALPCTYHAFHPTEDVLMKERRKGPAGQPHGLLWEQINQLHHYIWHDTSLFASPKLALKWSGKWDINGNVVE